MNEFSKPPPLKEDPKVAEMLLVWMEKVESNISVYQSAMLEDAIVNFVEDLTQRVIIAEIDHSRYYKTAHIDSQTKIGPALCGHPTNKFSPGEKPPDSEWCNDCVGQWLRENAKKAWPYKCHCIIINRDMDRDSSGCWMHNTKEGRIWENERRHSDQKYRINKIRGLFTEIGEIIDYFRYEKSPLSERLEETRLWFERDAEKVLQRERRYLNK